MVLRKEICKLTGFPNLKALKERLAEAQATGEETALALVDVDFFKAVNDEFGYDAGDRLLTELAAIFAEANPENIYRIGGDEFAFVMPKTPLEQAFLKMEAVRGQVEREQERLGLPPHRRITLTIGVAQYPRDAKDGQGLMKAADSAMVAAKENGKNQVALPSTEEMVMKSCYYPYSSVRNLKALAERLNRKESQLLREALVDVIRKYDQP
jgi:diguanylate cyclase